MNKTKKKQTHRYGEQTSDYQWGEGREEGQYRGRREKGLIWDYINQMCETSENCKALWNLKKLLFNK